MSFFCLYSWIIQRALYRRIGSFTSYLNLNIQRFMITTRLNKRLINFQILFFIKKIISIFMIFFFIFFNEMIFEFHDNSRISKYNRNRNFHRYWTHAKRALCECEISTFVWHCTYCWSRLHDFLTEIDVKFVIFCNQIEKFHFWECEFRDQ